MDRRNIVEEEERQKGHEDEGQDFSIPDMPVCDAATSDLPVEGMLMTSAVIIPADVCFGKCLVSVEQLERHLEVTCAQYEKRIATLVRRAKRSSLKQGLCLNNLFVTLCLSQPPLQCLCRFISQLDLI